MDFGSTPSFPLLPGTRWLRVVAPDGVLFMGQKELLDYLNSVQTNDFCLIELFEIELFDLITVCKQMTDAYLNR